MSTVARTLGPGVVLSRVLPILTGKTFLSDPGRRAEREAWVQGFERLERSIYKAVRGVIYRPSFVHELGRIQAPTLTLWGDEDVAISQPRARLLEEHIPDVRFHVVERAGHSATIENPQGILEHLVPFLSET